MEKAVLSRCEVLCLEMENFHALKREKLDRDGCLCPNLQILLLNGVGA